MTNTVHVYTLVSNYPIGTDFFCINFYLYSEIYNKPKGILMFTSHTYTDRHWFSSVLLYDQPFSRYKVDENRKCTEWQNDLEHLTVKRTLETLRNHHGA